MSEVDQQPEILEACWDHQQVLALFDDLASGAEIQHVQVRGSASAGSKDRQTTLDEARRLFDSHDTRAIQIRYAFDGETWCDTLMVFADAIRIIRTRGPMTTAM